MFYLVTNKLAHYLPDVTESENACNFSTFFKSKIDVLREKLDNAMPSAPLFSSFYGEPLTVFDLASQDEIEKVIIESSTKHCDLDPIPTYLLKNCLPDLLPCITHIINDSLISGVVPDCYKDALVKPLLKKPGLDFNVLKNFRPVSNLPFL